VYTASYLTTLGKDFESILDCDVTTDGSTIVSTSSHGLRLWNLATGECKASLEGHLEGVQGCAITPDNSSVISASLDYSLKVWDMDSGKCMGTLEGHDDDVNACAVAPDASFIISASDDRTLKMWKPNFQWPRLMNRSEEIEDELETIAPDWELEAIAPDWEEFETHFPKGWNGELCGYHQNINDIPALA